jgi:hypothetical protein
VEEAHLRRFARNFAPVRAAVAPPLPVPGMATEAVLVETYEPGAPPARAARRVPAARARPGGGARGSWDRAASALAVAPLARAVLVSRTGAGDVHLVRVHAPGEGCFRACDSGLDLRALACPHVY